MKPFQRGALWWLRVKRSDRRLARVSTGTTDKRAAIAIGNMVDDLAARAETRVLDAIADGRVTLYSVYAAYRTDQHIAEVQASIDDVDLDPLVATWHTYLVQRRLTSAEKYLAQVRCLIPKGTRFPSSSFRRKRISEHLAALDVTGSTLNRHRAALMQFGRWLVEREIFESNPVRDVRASTENAPRAVHHSPADLRALVKVLPDPYRALEAVMAGTGMEWQACMRLRRRDVDFEAKTLHAHGGKNAWRDRVCHVTELWTWPFIESYVRSFTPNALLFVGLTPDRAIAQHTAACTAAKLTRSRLHDHRHSYAVNAIRSGMPLHLVAAQLGHRDSTLVQKVYGKFVPQKDDFARYVASRERAPRERGKRARRAK